MNHETCAHRRERFCAQMDGGVALFAASREVTRSNDVTFPHRQDTDFYYLTGFSEPDAVAVLAPDHPEHPYVLFVRERDPSKEVWTGFRSGVEGACRDHGADAAFPIGELAERLPDLLADQPRVYLQIGKYPWFDDTVFEAVREVRRRVRTGVNAPSVFADPGPILHEMRLHKSDQDLEIMRQAARITCEAHIEAMRAATPGRREFEIQAVIEFIFRSRGAAGWGYPSICGSGPNTCILHYVDNGRLMEEGDLLLVDAGCEVDLFSADVTRTYPVSGTFTPRQRDIYQLVLEAQKAAIAQAVPGHTFHSVHDKAVRVLTEGLIEAGLIEGPVDDAIEEETYKKFYFHNTSHWLGMDVHDVGAYRLEGESRTLAPGMILTVEPGLYIPRGTEGVDEEWFDIGIRIEDDVLITPDGQEVLTSAAPKELAEVEAVLAEPCRLFS